MKILIVDDTAENIEAAQAYFSQNKDYEFVYASDRKTAEALLSECNGLLTDRDIPFMEGEKKEDYKLDRSGFYENARKSQGYALLAEATASNIPALMVSEHGSLILITLDDVQYAKELSEQLKSVDPYSQENFKLAFGVNSKASALGTYSGLSKSDPKTWEFALNKFKEKFKIDEQSNELRRMMR